MEMTVKDFVSFQELLRNYRTAMGWTQEELGKQWNYSFETISAWERGKRFPSNHEIPRIAKFLNMGPEALARCIIMSRNKTHGHATQETEEIGTDEVRREWSKAFDMWGEIQGIYRSRTEFSHSFSYLRMLENVHNVLAVGISLNAITLSYSREKIIESIIKNNASYQLCFLDPDGLSCAEREREEGYRAGFLADLTRLSMQYIETIQNRISRIGPKYVEQLQVSTYDLPPRFNIYIVDDTLMTVQCYAYGRGEETPLFILNRQSQIGLFDYYASVAKYILEQAKPLRYEKLATGEKLESRDNK